MTIETKINNIKEEIDELIDWEEECEHMAYGSVELSNNIVNIELTIEQGRYYFDPDAGHETININCTTSTFNNIYDIVLDILDDFGTTGVFNKDTQLIIDQNSDQLSNTIITLEQSYNGNVITKRINKGI